MAFDVQAIASCLFPYCDFYLLHKPFKILHKLDANMSIVLLLHQHDLFIRKELLHKMDYK